MVVEALRRPGDPERLHSTRWSTSLWRSPGARSVVVAKGPQNPGRQFVRREGLGEKLGTVRERVTIGHLFIEMARDEENRYT